MSASSPSLVALFDSICRNYGEYDAVISSASPPTCYLEIQQASNLLADQLVFRYGRPNLVLLDLNRSAAAELAAVLACMRLGIVFVPVDGTDPFRLQQTVDHLRSNGTPTIAAIVLAVNDADPRLHSFFHAEVHFCILVNERGEMMEPMTVPSLPAATKDETAINDDMYILFTSGTTRETAESKAVIGSCSQTLRRLYWFADEIQHQTSATTTVIARRTPLTFVDGVHELLSVLLTTHGDHTPGSFYCGKDLHDLASHSTRITMLPSQLGQILSSTLRSPLELVVVSGEPCPPSIIGQFQVAIKNKSFADTVRLFNFYGQTETVGDICFASLLDSVIVQDTVSIGRPLPGVSLRLDEDTHEVIVSGDSFANGYYSKRGESSSALCPFHTGDLGFCIWDVWYIRGRLGDVQKVNGILTSPTDIEARFQQVFGDCDCAAAIQQGSPYVLVTDANIKEGFSRQKMMEQQVPWNLIPRQVFYTPHPLPTTVSGKVQRSQIHRIVSEQLLRHSNDSLTTTPSPDALQQALSLVLRLPLTVETIRQIQTRSFIDLGGDSHIAVALWHKLRSSGLLTEPTNVKPIDLLQAATVEEMRLLFIQGVYSKKRRKMTSRSTQRTVSKLTTTESDSHVQARFSGCVDAVPMITEGFLYGACQGGTIQRFSVALEQHLNQRPLNSISIEGGWRIQANLVPTEEGIIACCHHSSDTNGLVVCTTKELDQIIWKRHIAYGIKATPCLRNGRLFVHGGIELFVMETIHGTILAQHSLHGTSECAPAPLDQHKLLYTFTDWDCDFQIVDAQYPDNITTKSIANHGGAPIQADPLVLGPNRAVTADVLGFVHDIDIGDGSVKSFKISSVPFSGALSQMADGHVILGCQDGVVRCLQESDLSNVLWSIDLGATIRCTVVPLQETKCIACTTAGGVFLISTSTLTPTVQKVGQVGGEIWSKVLPMKGFCSMGQTNKTWIAFGARDSRLHLIGF